MALITGAEPFSADRGEIGVVLSHGFTGTPASMRPWGEALAAAGYSVRVPLLPGHGTTWQDANRSNWRQWYATVEGAFDDLAARCRTVFACGLSMGGTLVTRLAEQKGHALAGLVLVNPAYATTRFDARFAPYIGWAIRSRPGIGSDIKKPGVEETGYDRTPVQAFASLQKLWRITVEDMDRITSPIKLYRSVEDHVVEPLSAEILTRRATATTVEEILLHDSYHVATLDNDARQIVDGSMEFFASLAPTAGR